MHWIPAENGPPILNLVRGDSAAGTAYQVLDKLGGLLIDPDTLTVGPLPPVGDLTERLSQRWQWHFDTLDAEALAAWEVEDGTPPIQPAWGDMLAAVRAAAPERVRLWCSPSMNDWLHVAFWVTQIQRAKLIAAPLEVVCIDLVEWEPGNRYVPGSLGEVRADCYLTPPPAIVVTPERAEELAAAWDAVAAPSPDGLNAFLDRPTLHWPLLRRAVRTLLGYYPAADHGLSRHQATMLAAVAAGESRGARLVSGVINASDETGDDVG